VGFAGGLVGGFFGLGGGIVLVPLIVYLLRRPMHIATVTSLAVQQFLATAAVLISLQAGRLLPSELVHLGLAATIAPAAVVGSFAIGVPLGRRIPALALRRLFAVFVLVAAARMVFISGQATALHDPWPRWIAAPAGLLVGAVSGLLGVGGGIVAVPMLAMGFGLTQHEAQATSLAIILPTVIAGTVRAQLGTPAQRPDWRLVLSLAPGAVLGGALGPVAASTLSARGLTWAFAGVMCVTAVQMLLAPRAKRAPRQDANRDPAAVPAASAEAVGVPPE
jgi:hypothetical protein